MAGNSNSGRRSNGFEKTRTRAVELSWALVLADLENPDLDTAVKREIYTRIALKNIPTELSGAITANLVAMGTVVKNEGELIFNIGSPINDFNPPEDTGHTR